MGTVYSHLDERLRKFIARQPMFFVATAPRETAAGDGGHVNVSPKGYRDTFAVLGPLTVAYVDLTGSGSETIAHLRQNGRITIMFCSFGNQPTAQPGFARAHRRLARRAGLADAKRESARVPARGQRRSGNRRPGRGRQKPAARAGDFV